MIDWKELLVVLRSYPKFREEFLAHLDLAYNLGAQPQQVKYKLKYLLLYKLTIFPADTLVM